MVLLIRKKIAAAVQNRPVRFLLAGGLNSLFGFLIYSAAILSYAPIWVALVLGLFAGIAFNFITTGGFVFRDISIHRLPRFVLGYLAIYAINYGLIHVLARWVSNAIYAQAILTPFLALFSYFLMSRFVFREQKTTI